MTSPSTSQTTARTDSLQYVHHPISSLVPGPIRANFTGTIVNIFGYGIDSTAPKAAKGCLKLLLRDSSGEILVKLWYAEEKYEEKILLGSRLSVSTTHVSTTASPGMDAAALRALPACVMTSIFPERDAGCAVQIHGVDGYDIDGVSSIKMDVSSNLNGLMDLEAFVNGAADGKFYEDVKLLVCVVGVSDLVTISTRKGTSFQVVPIQVLDTSTTTIHTQTAQVPRPTPTLIPLPVELSLSSNLAISTKLFVPNQTILLLTSPKLQSQSRRKIKLTPRSQILINPNQLETLHLRKWINNLYPPCNISASEIDDLICRIEEAKNTTCLSTSHRSSTAIFTPGSGLTFQPRKSQHRKQYTWSLFMNQISLQLEVPFTAYISVIITRLGLVDLWKRNELFCMPCPHHPGTDIYSNTPVGRCRNCDCTDTILLDDKTLTDEGDINEPHSEKGRVKLRFNPLLLSGVSDETGGFLISLPLVPPLSPSTLRSGSSLFSPIDTRTTFHSPSNSSTQMSLHRQHHNIYLSNKAIKSLTGLSHTDPIFSPHLNYIPTHTSLSSNTDTNTKADVLTHLQEIESLLLYRRVTLILGWSGQSTRLPESQSQSRSRSEPQYRDQNKDQNQNQNEKKEKFDLGSDSYRNDNYGGNKTTSTDESGRIIVLDVIT